MVLFHRVEKLLASAPTAGNRAKGMVCEGTVGKPAARRLAMPERETLASAGQAMIEDPLRR
jgi:hypothetical protein